MKVRAYFAKYGPDSAYEAENGLQRIVDQEEAEHRHLVSSSSTPFGEKSLLILLWFDSDVNEPITLQC